MTIEQKMRDWLVTEQELRAAEILDRAFELLDRIDIQSKARGAPVGGIDELKNIFQSMISKALHPYARSEIEADEKWREIVRQMPFINFPADWNVKVIPPFAGAVARFVVEKGGKSLSVYCDWYERLGCYGEPYWEIYPDADGDNSRFGLNDVTGLLSAIAFSLAPQPDKGE